MKQGNITLNSAEGIGLVLSGGGARGAYEAGAIKALAEAGIKFDVVAGSSVGALNAAWVSAGKIDRLINAWSSLRQKDIFLFNGETIFRQGALLSNVPLRKLIEKELDEKTVQDIINSSAKLLIIASSLQDKTKYIWQDFKNREEIIQALLSSAAIPGIFPYQALSKNGSSKKAIQLVDGAITDNCPVREVAELGLCKTIFAISLYTINPTFKKHWYKDLSAILTRSNDIQFSNAYRREMEYIYEKIELVKYLKELRKTLAILPGRAKLKKVEQWLNLYRVYDDLKIIEIIPAKELPLGYLDFVPQKTKIAMEVGYQDAKKILKNL